MRAMVAFTALLLLPGASAQIPWGEPLVTDPAGDLQMDNPAGTYDVTAFENIDLRALWLNEDPTHLHFMIELEDLEGAVTGGGDSSVRFTIGEWRYRVFMLRGIDQEEGFFGSISRTHTSTGEFESLGGQRVFGNVEAGRIWTSIDRDLLRTPTTSMAAGTVIEDIQAVGRWQEFTAMDTNWRIWDRAPDANPGPSVTLEWNKNEANGLRFTTDQPFRASNGEETTYQWRVTVRNPSDAPITAPLSIEGAPAAWNVSLPGTRLTLDAGQTHRFPVTADVPFAHQHGAAESFQLVAGATDAPLALLELGVFYLPTPQPAGHHATLFIHTHPWSTQAAVINPPLGGGDGYATFNTLQEDPGATSYPVSASAWIADSTRYRWHLCLDPELAMGLEWDLEGLGQTNLQLAVRSPVQDATITGEFRIVPASDVNNWCGYFGDGGTPVARFSDNLGDLAPMTTATVNADIEPLVSRVEHRTGQQLILQLVMTAPTPSPSAIGSPQLLPGGSFTLPLLEYHDALEVTSAVVADAAAPQVLTDAEPEVKDTPFVSVALVLALAVLAARRR